MKALSAPDDDNPIPNVTRRTRHRPTPAPLEDNHMPTRPRDGSMRPQPVSSQGQGSPKRARHNEGTGTADNNDTVLPSDVVRLSLPPHLRPLGCARALQN